MAFHASIGGMKLRAMSRANWRAKRLRSTLGQTRNAMMQRPAYSDGSFDRAAYRRTRRLDVKNRLILVIRHAWQAMIIWLLM